MYISLNSGHHRASLGLEQAICQLSPETSLLSVNALHHTHPFLEKLIKASYFSLLRWCPRVWNYLYDRPGVVRGTRPFKYLLYRFNLRSLRSLLEEFKPDVVACTQAFPCGMVAAYKKARGVRLPLIGILTDYHAHSYWIAEEVDYYVVPTEETKGRLRKEGIPEERILAYGIPIDPRFGQSPNRGAIFQKLGLDPERATLLIMGGSYGFGPMEEIVGAIDSSELDVQVIVVCGKNERLFNRLSRTAVNRRKPMRLFRFVDTIDELMEIATCLITKPGGITTAEALAKGLPMVIFMPIGGQEAANADFLLKKGIALKAQEPGEVLFLLRDLLQHPKRLSEMRRSAERHARPAGALDLARFLLSLS